MKARKALIVVLGACVAIACVACSPTQEANVQSNDEGEFIGEFGDRLGGNKEGYDPDGRYVDGADVLADVYSHSEKDTANAEDKQPKTRVDENGFTIQQTPSDPLGWNISYLNADERGCNSCHSLEDMMLSMDTYHGLTFPGYPAEQNYDNCFVCHSIMTPLSDTIHSIHNRSEIFTEQMDGTCESCHYISPEGEFKRWDTEKYDLLRGITDVSSEEANLDVSYDQTTITPTENMFYKSIKSEPSLWRSQDAAQDRAVFDEWTIKVEGELENPIEMTLPELIEKFGTKDVVMKQQCIVNGVGNPFIFQVKATGIPIKDILDYCGVKEGANAYQISAEDPYPNYILPLDKAMVDDALLVIKVNGENLSGPNGYPVSAYIPRASGASVTKVITGINIATMDESEIYGPLSAAAYGDFVDPKTGKPASKPNSGVLNMPNGVVLEGKAGEEMQLEGFADAWNEPIEKIEFSLDHGATWTVMETPNNDSTYWTYWRMKFTPPEQGSYLLQIRTTSIQPDGTERVSTQDTKFLFNVK